MCGIFGFSGKKGQHANIKNLQILALYNRERGTDSCGYYWNGNVVKGVDTYGVNGIKEADIGKFMARNKFIPGDLDCEVFIGHTRKSTYGTNSLENAHPFVIDNYVQVHNGTIRNMDDVTKKHGIRDWFTVDSKGLALAVNKIGFKVLEEYLGYAALAMTWKTRPNSLYLFHGASKDFETDKFSWVERPLYTLIQPEGIYYSSLEEPLIMISSDENQPVELPCNQVIEIVDGEFSGWKEPINRWNKNIEKSTFTRLVDYVSPPPVVTPNSPTVEQLPQSSILTDENTDDIIRKDVSPLEENSKDIVYSLFGRHYANGQLLEGLVYIDDYGKISKSKSSFDRRITEFYFVRGVMLNGQYSYKQAMRLNAGQGVTPDMNVAMQLSQFSRYPVMCLEEEGQNVLAKFKNKWYENGKVVVSKQAFTPKFCRKTYFIQNGKTVEIRPGKVLF